MSADTNLPSLAKVTDTGVWIAHFSKQDTLKFKPIRDNTTKMRNRWGIGLVIALALTITGVAKLILAGVKKPLIALAIGAGLVVNRIVYNKLRIYQHRIACEQLQPLKQLIEAFKNAEAAMKGANAQKTTPFFTFAQYAAEEHSVSCGDIVKIWQSFHVIIRVNQQNLGEAILRSHWSALVSQMQGLHPAVINPSEERIEFLRTLKNS